MEQNYFEYNAVIYQQMEGLAMGAPTSPILSEIFIQHGTHTDTEHFGKT
jgi:hypothetical protein